MTVGRALVLLLAIGTGAAHASERTEPAGLEHRAAAGDRNAARRLAEGYYAGVDGLPQDFAQAARYFQVLANLGDTRAMTTLGLMYARGIGVPKNMSEAVRKWRFAAANEKTADAGAEYNLGLAYRAGEGTQADPATSHYWMRRAARRGHVLAQTNLGVMHLEGYGTARDAVEGAAWLIVASNRGDAGAQENLKRFAEQLGPETLVAARKRAAVYLNGAPAVR
jgi:TPR repeat protein